MSIENVSSQKVGEARTTATTRSGSPNLGSIRPATIVRTSPVAAPIPMMGTMRNVPRPAPTNGVDELAPQARPGRAYQQMTAPTAIAIATSRSGRAPSGR